MTFPCPRCGEEIKPPRDYTVFVVFLFMALWVGAVWLCNWLGVGL